MPPSPTKTQPPGTPPDDLAGWYRAIAEEVAKGLPNEQDRRLRSITSQDYYRRRGAKLIERRPAESEQDFAARIKRHTPITRRVIDILAKLYEQPPERTIDGDKAATKWLAEVYDATHADVVLQQAEAMSLLHGMCAIQVAATGDPASPIAMQLWSGWHEIVPFEAPGRANRVAACVTVDCCDNQTRYTLWTPDRFDVYITKKLTDGQTAGGRIAAHVPAESGDNPYGILPFAFFWGEMPSSGIDEQEGLGPFLSEWNHGLDVEASDLAQAVQKYHAPFPVAYGVDEDVAIVRRPGAFARIAAADDESEHAPEARLEYLQANLNIEAGLRNIGEVIDSNLQALGVPLTAYSLESRHLPSGEALLAEQKPLADFARKRRPLALMVETDLARACLTVYGRWHAAAGGSRGLSPAAALKAAERPVLSLLWPAASIDLPSAERDREDRSAVGMGIESRVMVVMRRYGYSREQALAHIKQVADDEAEVAKLMPAEDEGQDEGDDNDNDNDDATGDGAGEEDDTEDEP